jgi:hypothetical protein
VGHRPLARPAKGHARLPVLDGAHRVLPVKVNKPHFGPYSVAGMITHANRAVTVHDQLASVIMAAPTVALVVSSIRMRPPVVRFLA